MLDTVVFILGITGLCLTLEETNIGQQKEHTYVGQIALMLKKKINHLILFFFCWQCNCSIIMRKIILNVFQTLIKKKSKRWPPEAFLN